MALRTWLSEPQREVSGPGFQGLNARFQDLDLRTWVSGPGYQDLGFRPSTRGFRTWISGPGFQDLESSPSYGRLIFFPSLFSASTVTLEAGSPIELSVRPTVRAGSIGELKRRTVASDRRTHRRSEDLVGARALRTL